VDDPIQHVARGPGLPVVLVVGLVAAARDVDYLVEVVGQQRGSVLGLDLEQGGDVGGVLGRRVHQLERAEDGRDDGEVELGVEEPTLEYDVAVGVVAGHDREQRLQGRIGTDRVRGHVLVEPHV
jgi:hypothetical protein